VLSEDKKAISQAPGIGPKTAARIILELKDKLASTELAADGGQTEVPETASGHSNASDAVEALMVLGYSRSETQRALKDIDIVTLPLEEIIRLALKKLIK